MSTAARGTETQLQHLGSNWTMGFRLRLILSNQVLQKWKLCLASAQHSGLSAAFPHQSTGTAGWQLPAQSHNLPSAMRSPGTQRAQQYTACDPRKKHVWMTRHTSGGTSYLFNHLQNMQKKLRQKKYRQNKCKLNHYGIQCFSKQTEFTLENSKERGVCVWPWTVRGRRAVCCTLCQSRHNPSHSWDSVVSVAWEYEEVQLRTM